MVRLIITFVCVSLLLGCGNCGGQPEYCKGLELGASEGKPLDLIPITMDLEPEEEGAEPIDPGHLFAEVKAKGLSDRYYTSIERDPETQQYSLVVPPHPDGIEGGKIKLKIRGQDGECNGRDAFEVLPIPAAPGTLETVVEKMKRVIELQTEKLGFTMEDLATNDITELPGPLWGHAAYIGGIDDPENANSLLALARNEADIDVSDGQELANALLAKAGYVAALDGAIASLEAIGEPEEPLEFQRIQAFRTRQQALCEDLIVKPNFGGAAALSYYMKLADSASSKLAAGGPKLIDDIGTALGLVPHPAFQGVGMIFSTLAFYKKSTMLAYSNTLPSQLIQPTVEPSRKWFEEDSEESGTWKDTYKVQAKSNGWNATGTLLEGLFLAVESIVGSAGLADDLLAASKAESVSITSNLEQAAATNTTKGFLSQVEGDCNYPSSTWGPINVSDTRWSEVEYEGAIKAKQGDRWSYEPADVGEGTITLNVVPSAFPPATNKLASLLIEPIEVREIIVTVDPGIERIEPGGSLQVRAVVQNAVDKRVEWVLLAPQMAGADVTPTGDVDGDGNPTATVTGASSADDYPVRIKAKSLSVGGIRTPSSPERAGFGIYNADERIIVRPPFRCVKPGETQDYEVIVAGSDDENIDWTATGGSIQGSGLEATYRAESPGLQEVKATHPGLDISDSATVVVNECKCEFDAIMSGMAIAQFGGYSKIAAVTQGRSLTINLIDEESKNQAQILSLTTSGHGVEPGVPGTYDAHGAMSPEGVTGIVDSYTTFGNAEEDVGKLTIESWEDHYITGFFVGRAVLFYTIPNQPEERVWVDLYMRFRLFVNETTDILGVAQYNCGLEE